MRILLPLITPILLTFCLFLELHAQKGSLQGVVKDSSNLEFIPFATVAIYQEGSLVTGTDTDFDGNYMLSNLDPGVYDVEADFLGFATHRIEGVIVRADQSNRLDILMVAEGQSLDEVVITAYKVPLISVDETSSGGTVTGESIKKLPSRSISALAATTAGLSTVNGSDISVRGSRGNSTYVYIDGVRVSCNQANQLIKKHKRKAKRKANNKPPTQVDETQEPQTPQYTKIGEVPTEVKGTKKDYGFVSPLVEPLSTMSIDVDRASYSNIRGYLKRNTLPPLDAVRVEEMVNYFSYDYDLPISVHPFSTQTTLTTCPWNQKHQVLHVVLQATEEPDLFAKQSQLVFLVDVSGSMSSPNKLPLVIESMKMLVEQMKEEDRVAIVTYAGRSSVVLPSTSVSDKAKILEALSSLTSGGSTAGAQGINTAYQIAEKHFIKSGNNRVILATDGDFNVGVSSDQGLVELIEQKRKSGIFLSVLGYGYGNYQDGKMQMLANKGNGNHAYIDSAREAYKILIREYASTLYSIAKDVKVQIEFNPAVVKSYKLIGYENRRLNPEDFNNDQVDAGEMGVGHTVTALYEIIPADVKSKYSVQADIDPLIYQEVAKSSTEIGSLKMRYKYPKNSKSIKVEAPIPNALVKTKEIDSEIKYSLGVAECGLLLSESTTAHQASYDHVLTSIEDGLGNDLYEERAEFEEMVKKIQQLTSSASID